MAKFTFADAKVKIKELEEQLSEAKKDITGLLDDIGNEKDEIVERFGRKDYYQGAILGFLVGIIATYIGCYLIFA